MKALLTALVLVSTSTFVYSSPFSSGSCNVGVNGGVRISQSEIEFLKNDNHLYKIVNNSSLIVDGNEISLTTSQQSLVSQYSNDIRSLIPQSKDLATDALALASEGVNLAFNELLGEGNTLGKDLSVHFNEISNEIENNFLANKVIHFDEKGFSKGDFFGDDFEQRIEEAVEETVQNSIGSLMIAIGQELLFSGGNIDAFETRMKSFGERIGHEMETRSAEIEKQANGLCESLSKIDNLEEEMKQHISEISTFNLLTTSINSNDKA